MAIKDHRARLRSHYKKHWHYLSELRGKNYMLYNRQDMVPLRIASHNQRVNIDNNYLASQMCGLFHVQGAKTYMLHSKHQIH